MIKIIYEDEDVVVVDKPAGLSVHPDGYNQEQTLVDWLVEKYPGITQVGDKSRSDEKAYLRPGIVHRLDKDTSGVMIVAKTNHAFNFLKDQFKTRQAKKTYQAIVTGRFADPTKEQTIDIPIGRSKNNPKIRVASLKADGLLRPAKTVFKVLKQTATHALVEAYPETGRTHQLRAHFKALQHPIICDHLYAKGGVCPPGLSRQALHALKLSISLPQGDKKDFEASLPADFKLALDNLDLS